MKKKLFAIAGILQGVSFFLSSLYALVVAFLDWRAYAVFVPLAGLLAALIVNLDGNTERSLADTIAQKINNATVRRLCALLFKGGRVIVILISIAFLGPFIAPLLINSCFKGNKVYVLSIFCNMACSALWIYIYLVLAGWMRTIWWLKWLVPQI